MNGEQKTSAMQEAAESALDRGFYVFALAPGTKIPRPGTHGHLDATAMPRDIEKLWNENPEYNPAVSCAASNLIVLDYDEGNPPPEIEAIRTFKVKTSRGVHVYFWGQMPGTKLYDPSGKKIGEIKSSDGYVLAAGARHPNGIFYTIIDDSPLVDAPMEIIQRFIRKPVEQSASVAGEKIPFGSHDLELTRIAGKLRRDGLEEEAIYHAIVEVCEKRCEGYGADYLLMCRKIAKSVCNYPAGAPVTLTIGGKDPETGVQVTAPSTEPPVVNQQANASITIPFSEEVFYGLVGRIIKKLQPQTESHPVGNLLELLACFGNIVGACAYCQVDGTRHHTNIFVVKVGKSSKSRKGTGKARIEEIVRQLDPVWYANRNISGLGSGEIVVHEVRDPQRVTVKDKKTGQYRIEEIPGAEDKRLFVSEGEFSGVLTIAGRKESTLSSVIRDAWDHKTIRNMAKSGSTIATDPHISISADITRSELSVQLREADKSNGFANRFLWCFVERQGLLPFGGEDINWSEEVIELHKAAEFAKKQRRVFMDRNARLMWERIYEDLSKEVPGVPGDVTSRGEAQVIRLALIFAMLDLSDHIAVEHLKAAKALWEYCEDSARVIFGGVMKEHEQIVTFLRTGPKTITEVGNQLFHKNKAFRDIRADLNTLVALGRVYAKTDDNVERFQLIGN